MIIHEQEVSSSTIVPAMTLDEARQITNQIKATTEELWSLLLRAYEGKAWQVLGYRDWAGYVEGEFSISRRHSYRLIDQGIVIRELAAASGQSVTRVSHVSHRDVEAVKPDLPAVTNEIRERVESGEEPKAVVQSVVEKHRERRHEEEWTKSEPATASGQSVTRVSHITDEQYASEQAALLQELEDADREIQQLHRTLESLQRDDSAQEIQRLNQKIFSLEGRIQGLLTESATAKEQARHGRRALQLLMQVKELLGVRRDDEIVPTIQGLLL